MLVVASLGTDSMLAGGALLGMPPQAFRASLSVEPGGLLRGGGRCVCQASAACSTDGTARKLHVHYPVVASNGSSLNCSGS